MALRNASKNLYWINEGNFFSSNVLDHRISEMNEFKSLNNSEISNIYSRIKKKWHEDYWPIFNSSKGNIEDDTKRFIGFVLSELHFKFQQERKLKGKKSITFERPDYVLFSSNEDILISSDAEDEFKFSRASAFLEAKTFCRDKINNLDSVQVRSLGIGEKVKCRPVDQLVSCMVNGKKDWGILTNGAIWRLYSLKSKNPKSQYFEINLMDLILHDEITEEFKLFYFLFSSNSLKESQEGTRLDLIFNLSQKYSDSIGPYFYKSCIEAIKLLFVEITKNKKIINQKVAEDSFNTALLVLYKLISIRYLEDKGVLPINSPEYRTSGLDSLRIEIEQLYRKGEVNLIKEGKYNYWNRVLKLFSSVNIGDYGVSLKVQALQAELFDSINDFDDIKISDICFVQVIDFLCRGSHDKDAYQIDYYDLGVHKIGDLYDRVLSLKIIKEKNKYILVDSNSNKKRDGSYFTHPILTKLMSEQIKKSIEDKYLNKGNYTFSVLDNSVGSGHFLRQVGDDIAEYISNSDYNLNSKTPLTKEEALRIIVENCLFGVDINPNAVWLTKLSLWLATASKNKPFVLIENNIIVGDSLIASKDYVNKDKLLSNKTFIESLKKIKSTTSFDAKTLSEKRKLWESVQKSVSKELIKRSDLVGTSNKIYSNHFYWEQKFPSVFFLGKGFTVVCGNPPWDTVKPKVPDFYKSWTGQSKAPNRDVLDEWLKSEKEILNEYSKYEKAQKEYAEYLKSRDEYTYQEGEVQTHSYFTEKSIELLSKDGLLVYVTKLGIYTDKFQKKMRDLIYNHNSINSLHIFQRNKFDDGIIFFNVDPNEKFIVLNVQKGRRENYDFNGKYVQEFSDITNDFEDWMTYNKNESIDPESNVIEIFEDLTKKKILEKIARVHSLKQSNIEIFRELDVTLDRDLITNRKTNIPVFTGETCFHYYLKKPNTYSTALDTDRFFLFEKTKIGIRNILPNSVRKIYACELPKKCLTQNSLLCIDIENSNFETNYLLAYLNSCINEYFIRPKLSNLNLNNFRLEMFRVPSQYENQYASNILKIVDDLKKKINPEEIDSSNENAELESLCMLSFNLSISEAEEILKSFNYDEDFIKMVQSFMKQHSKKRVLAKVS